MKAGILAALLIAAVLAERVAARPQEDSENFQEDEPDDGDDVARESSPPKPIVVKSASMTLTQKPGDTVWLHCDVENAPTVAWLNDTKTLAINRNRLTFRDDDRITFYPNNTLEIRDLRVTDKGPYTCKLNEHTQLRHFISMFEIRNGAPVTKISFTLLLGAVVLLLTRL